MTRRITALACGLIAACAVEHGLDADARVESDARTTDDTGQDALAGGDSGREVAPDAFFCPDRDGDGARDAACGGDDCDDTISGVGPGRSVCFGPALIVDCVGATRVEEPCPSATPDCDFRRGECVASACGDHVMQSDEQCDGSTELCMSNCIQGCLGERECGRLPAANSCIPIPGSANGGCGPSTPGGLGLASPCLVNLDCESSYCESDSGLCTTGCGNDRPGPVAMSWCSIDEFTPFTPGTFIQDHLARGPAWHFTCARESDCTGGRHCSVVVGDPTSGGVITATCLPTLSTGGAALGAVCMNGGATCDSNTCLSSMCTVPCVVDADCTAPLARCTDYDYTDLVAGIVQPWPAPRICAR